MQSLNPGRIFFLFCCSRFLFLFALFFCLCSPCSFGLCFWLWPVFSSKSFIVSGLIFRSLVHFELFCVCGVRKCSNFILLHVAVQFSQHHLLKRLSFLHCIFLPPLSKIRWPYVCGLCFFILQKNVLAFCFVFILARWRKVLSWGLICCSFSKILR